MYPPPYFIIYKEYFSGVVSFAAMEPVMCFSPVHNFDEAKKVLQYIKANHRNLNSIRGELKAVKADGSHICVSSISMDFEGLETWVLHYMRYCTEIMIEVDVD